MAVTPRAKEAKYNSGVPEIELARAHDVDRKELSIAN